MAIRPDILLQRAEFSLNLLPIDVVDAEGLDLETVGEDRTCGKNSDERSATTARNEMEVSTK